MRSNTNSKPHTVTKTVILKTTTAIMTQRFIILQVILSCGFIGLTSSSAVSQSADDPAQPPSVRLSEPEPNKLADDFSIYWDIIALYNPLAIVGVVGTEYKHPYDYSDSLNVIWSHWILGGTVAVNPAYAQIAVYGEWMPWGFLTLYSSYELFTFWGTLGNLHSFDNPTDNFSDTVLFEDRKGEEEAGLAHRVLLRPTIQGQIRRICIVNQTNFSFQHFTAKGPYYAFMEYDTLVAQNDWVIDNAAQLLYYAWQSTHQRELLMGPLYQVTYAVKTEIIRHRLGGLLFFKPFRPHKLWGQFHFFTVMGTNLVDANRQKDFFGIWGFGSSYSI